MLKNSAFEEEIYRLSGGLRAWFYRHDRFVIIALISSVIPFPPASVIALTISLVNLRLIARGQLSTTETRTVWVSIFSALLGLLLFFSLLVFFTPYYQEIGRWLVATIRYWFGLNMPDSSNITHHNFVLL